MLTPPARPALNWGRWLLYLGQVCSRPLLQDCVRPGAAYLPVMLFPAAGSARHTHGFQNSDLLVTADLAQTCGKSLGQACGRSGAGLWGRPGAGLGQISAAALRTGLVTSVPNTRVLPHKHSIVPSLAPSIACSSDRSTYTRPLATLCCDYF